MNVVYCHAVSSVALLQSFNAWVASLYFVWLEFHTLTSDETMCKYH
jgi:hypothetical protein